MIWKTLIIIASIMVLNGCVAAPKPMSDAQKRDYAKIIAYCDFLSNRLKDIAVLRDQGVNRHALEDEHVMVMLQKKYDPELIMEMYMWIVVIYHAPKFTPDDVKKQTYSECFKLFDVAMKEIYQ